MRLSPKGWNNILIFSALLIIFIFNFGHKLSLSPKVHQRSVIDKNLTILEIKTPDYKIERIGRTWKSEPHIGLSEMQLAQLVTNWQSLKLETHAPVDDTVTPYLIHVYTTSQETPFIVQLFQYGDHYLIQTDPSMSLLLNEKQLPLLIGR